MDDRTHGMGLRRGDRAVSARMALPPGASRAGGSGEGEAVRTLVTRRSRCGRAGGERRGRDGPGPGGPRRLPRPRTVHRRTRRAGRSGPGRPRRRHPAWGADRDPHLPDRAFRLSKRPGRGCAGEGRARERRRAIGELRRMDRAVLPSPGRRARAFGAYRAGVSPRPHRILPVYRFDGGTGLALDRCPGGAGFRRVATPELGRRALHPARALGAAHVLRFLYARGGDDP